MESDDYSVVRLLIEEGEIKVLDAKISHEGLGEVAPSGLSERRPVSNPELASPRDLDSNMNENLVQLLGDGIERRTLSRNGHPATANQIGQCRFKISRDGRTLMIFADSSTELFELLMVSEGLLTSSNLPKNDTKTVNVTLFVELLELHDFGGHPKRLKRA